MVLVAVASTGGGVVNQHFGRADEFWVYEAGAAWAKLVGVRSVTRHCGGPDHCLDRAQVLAATVELLSDCAAVVCAKIGPQPARELIRAGIEPVEVCDLIDPAVAALGGRLTAAAPGEDETRRRDGTARVPDAPPGAVDREPEPSGVTGVTRSRVTRMARS